MNKSYAAVRLFFRAKKMKPKAANPNIMAKPTPQVRPMPLVSQIVEVDGKKLLDGGTCDSVPITYSLLTGRKKHIVVLTQDATYEKGANKLMPVLSQMYADFPHYLERLRYRHVEYNRTYRQVARMHEAGEVFAIQPQRPVEVHSMEHDQDKLLDLYEQGYAEAARTWDDLQEYLAK